MKATNVKERDVVKKILPLTVKSYDIVNYDEAVNMLMSSENAICTFLNHDSPFSWMSAPIALLDWMNESGVSDRFTMVANYHKILLKIPFLGKIAKAIGGNVTLTGMSQTVEFLKSNKNVILGTMPEGDNCCFDFDNAIAPFKQFGLIKAAILSDSKMIIVVHKGTKEFDVTVPFLARFKNKYGINIPIKVKPIDLKLKFEVFDPNITSNEFEKLSKEKQRLLIKSLAYKMRVQMMKIHNTL